MEHAFKKMYLSPVRVALSNIYTSGHSSSALFLISTTQSLSALLEITVEQTFSCPATNSVLDEELELDSQHKLFLLFFYLTIDR